ncbi:thiol:disulfide interchange protein DsbD [Mucilaginibacter gracilis]|uniref:Thiol:disulfide interchange protein DsbD n=1 Tax=Mucilaginibacter gracilis TaxID=423350 RepID=A0A495IYR1_9SPHI|nr:thioredoxin family protein [Mucilaginibacter gracilis]RKR81208.1 thiol:disulfide interchange protein DsbD [Mucilaginibacter gracilis]
MKSKLPVTTLFLIVLLFFSAPLPAAAQSKAADTVSTADVQFTSIPTAADSMAAKKEAAKKNIAAASKKQTISTAATKTDAPRSLWAIFLAGFIGGFAALIMPCIFPMIPLTVSFFLKRGGTRNKGITQAIIYGLSIILIYVFLGLVIAAFFGSASLNALATNGIFNFFFFILLLVFGASFLGAFEISLPSSLANKLDENSDKGGLSGLFFMAATLAVVSFSCTGPIIGTVLVDAAIKGERIGPAIAMFGFSLALAIPFTLFAIFPSLLKSMPKSGGWLNSVKVVLGFLELAFSVKFLSNVDLAYHWNWFDREIFLSLWIVIGFLGGMYLIGKLKFAHDSDLPFISVSRIFLSIITFAFVLYMIPGMWGAPLKFISAYLPPPATQDFNLYNLQLSSGSATKVADVSSVGAKKYEDIFKRGKVAGLEGWYDYDQALKVSKLVKKPVLLDFTGWNCVNCRKMENNVWSNPDVLKRLQNDFVMVELYVDDKTELDKNEQFISSYSGKKITTLGAKWSDLQASRFNSNSQPDYVILDSNGNLFADKDGNTIVKPQGANYDPAEYAKFLDSGITEYKKNNGSN